jgi:hypothetical protein
MLDHNVAVTEAPMKWNLRSHGDLLEFYAADFVASRIPAYERTWAIYIGHDGKGHPSDLIDNQGRVLGKESSEWRKREEFAQYHYTALEALYSLSKLDNLNTVGGAYPHYNNSFLTVNNNLILFHAQLGRAKDALTKAANRVAITLGSNVELQLKALWDPRNIVLHGPRLPLTWLLNDFSSRDVFIVEPTYESGGWNDKDHMLWSDIDSKSLHVSLGGYVMRKEALAVELACQIFEKINSAVMTHLKAKGLRIREPSTENYHMGFGISGDVSDAWKGSLIGPTLPLSGSTTAIFGQADSRSS